VIGSRRLSQRELSHHTFGVLRRCVVSGIVVSAVMRLAYVCVRAFVMPVVEAFGSMES